ELPGIELRDLGLLHPLDDVVVLHLHQAQERGEQRDGEGDTGVERAATLVIGGVVGWYEIEGIGFHGAAREVRCRRSATAESEPSNRVTGSPSVRVLAWAPPRSRGHSETRLLGDS